VMSSYVNFVGLKGMIDMLQSNFWYYVVHNNRLNMIFIVPKVFKYINERYMHKKGCLE
jgi:hypothetical protein